MEQLALLGIALSFSGRAIPARRGEREKLLRRAIQRDLEHAYSDGDRHLLNAFLAGDIGCFNEKKDNRPLFVEMWDMIASGEASLIQRLPVQRSADDDGTFLQLPC